MTANDEARKALEGVTMEMTPGRAVQFHPSYCSEAKDANVKDWDASHDLSVIRSDGSRYRIGHFRHASDAMFDQLCRNHIHALLADLAAKDAEIARLREATAPFDRMAGAMFARNWNRDDSVLALDEPDRQARLTFADFLALRAALKGDTHE